MTSVIDHAKRARGRPILRGAVGVASSTRPTTITLEYTWAAVMKTLDTTKPTAAWKIYREQ